MARVAVAQGLQPILAGRNEKKLQAVADPLQLECRVARLDDRAQLDQALNDIDVVVNIAGPFATTAHLMLAACLRTRTHYLDVTGELDVFEAVSRYDAEARQQGVMLMPGVGFAVVPSDCLAAYVSQKLPDAQSLKIGITRAAALSRGSMKTIIGLASNTAMIRRNGSLVSVPLGSLMHDFDYGRGARSSLAVSWPDVFTAFYTTGVLNIEAYFEANGIERRVYQLGGILSPVLRTAPAQIFLRTLADLLPEGPPTEDAQTATLSIVVEAQDRSGKRCVARLRTPDGYTLSVDSALAVVKKVLGGTYQVGFQTPARVYGADFILDMHGVEREDL